MARQPMDIRKRIERQEKKIMDLTDQLHLAQEEYEQMKKELEEQEKAEIFDAYQKSHRSYAEVIDFLKGKADIYGAGKYGKTVYVESISCRDVAYSL